METATIEAAEVRPRLDAGGLLIDTLPPDHFRQIHLPEARNACVYEITFLDQVRAITGDNHRPVIVYGSSARSRDAATAAAKLRRAGFTRVVILAGGLQAWQEAGHAVAGEAPGATDEPATRIKPVSGRYRLDGEQSLVDWTGRSPTARHRGTLRFDGGYLNLENNLLSGELEIDMDTLENSDLAGDELQPVLISHLKSDDFFFVERFPTALFRIRAGRLAEPPWVTSVNCTVDGELTLCGVTADLGFAATVSTFGEDMVGLEAHFDLDRTRWNVIYGSARSFEHLGMHAVFDAVSIEVRLRLIKA